MLRKAVRSSLGRLRRWLEEEPEGRPPNPEEDDFIYPWLNSLFSEMARHGLRRSYAWGVLQGVNLARALGIHRVSLIEFGVAGGNGQVALEGIAEKVEDLFGVRTDIYGFDMATGLPKPRDHRDVPNLTAEGLYPMDQEKLKQRLKKASLILGALEHTMPEFIRAKPSPVAFIACDLVLYTSTVHALKVLEGDHDMLLPRIHCYFDDTLGFTFGDHNGERLAISEFNAAHQMRKLSPIYGLKHYVAEKWANEMWTEKFWMAHIFDHPLYARRDNLVGRHRLELRP